VALAVFQRPKAKPSLPRAPGSWLKRQARVDRRRRKRNAKDGAAARVASVRKDGAIGRSAANREKTTRGEAVVNRIHALVRSRLRKGIETVGKGIETAGRIGLGR